MNNYAQSGFNQSAFGGFNFGMNSNVSSLNLNSGNNSNLPINHCQSNINNNSRDTILTQSNKIPGFDQQSSNKCWSVGKLPTR